MTEPADLVVKEKTPPADKEKEAALNIVLQKLDQGGKPVLEEWMYGGGTLLINEPAKFAKHAAFTLAAYVTLYGYMDKGRLGVEYADPALYAKVRELLPDLTAVLQICEDMHSYKPGDIRILDAVCILKDVEDKLAAQAERYPRYDSPTRILRDLNLTALDLIPDIISQLTVFISMAQGGHGGGELYDERPHFKYDMKR